MSSEQLPRTPAEAEYDALTVDVINARRAYEDDQARPTGERGIHAALRDAFHLKLRQLREVRRARAL
jgi:hypothetical protein